jgi:hypothetical protein
VEAGVTHLEEHAAQSLADLLAEAQLGACARDARVAREAGDVEWISEVGESGEAAGAADLDPVVEDLHADVGGAAAGRSRPPGLAAGPRTLAIAFGALSLRTGSP